MKTGSFPWLWPYGEAAAFRSDVHSTEGGVALHLNTRREKSDLNLVPQFIPSREALGALDYERCVHKGQIPTRDLGHDWYNGLVWLRFAQAWYLFVFGAAVVLLMIWLPDGLLSIPERLRQRRLAREASAARQAAAKAASEGGRA